MNIAKFLYCTHTSNTSFLYLILEPKGTIFKINQTVISSFFLIFFGELGVLGSEDPTPLDPVPDPRIRRSEDPDPLDPLAWLLSSIRR